MTDGDGLATMLEQYLDAAPRTGADAEQVGPFTLFVGRGSWGYYARPRLGLAQPVDPDDVAHLLARQRELDVPTEVEWQPSITPSLAGACRAAGMTVHTFALMVHDGQWTQLEDGVRLLTPHDDLEPALAAQQVGFGAAAAVESTAVEHLRSRIEAGTTRVAVGWDGTEVVSVGMHQPVGAVTEVVGVATVPQHRQRGWGARVTRALAHDAYTGGASTVFLSAEADAVARVYERAGFRRVGEVCAAEAG